MAKKNNNVKSDQLRQAAEHSFSRSRSVEQPADIRDIEALLQELQVHQIELELQNEELLIANEEIELQRLKFEAIYDLAPVGYFILDHLGIIEDVNIAGANMLGWGKLSVKRRRLQSFIKPGETDDFHFFFKRLVKQSDRQRSQFKFVNKNHSEFYGLLEGRFDKPSQRCFVALLDVTEGIASRIDMAETKDRLQLALEASAAGTWELHLPSMRFYLDDIYTRIGGTGRFNGTYNGFIALVHADDRFEVDQHLRSAINQETEIDTICRFMDERGRICFMNIRGHLINTEQGPEKRFIGIMCDITEKRKLEEEAKNKTLLRQQEITFAALQAEEKERVRISEALHDSVSQLLYGIKIQLGQLTEGKVKTTADKLNQLLDMAIQETRNISFELAPSILTDFGLASAVTELAERLSSAKLRITVTCSGFSGKRDLVLESMIFRIVQELINNCMKHSAASQVKIQIKKNKHIEIVVKDNGKGFLPSESATLLHGAGLSSIKNRISLYKGTMDISAPAGKGTAVTIKLEHHDH